MHLKSVICLLFVCLFSFSSAFSQRKGGKYDAIIKTTDGKRYKGLLEAAHEDKVSIWFHQNLKSISTDSIKTIRIKRHHAQNRHLLAGSLLGLASGLTLYKSENDKGNTGPIVLPVVIISSTVAGAAVSGLINSLTSVEKFENLNEAGNYTKIRENLLRYSANR